MRTRKQRMHEECSRHLLTRLQNPKFVLVFAHVSALFAFVADTGDNTLAELTVDESTGQMKLLTKCRWDRIRRLWPSM
jgi:hypothetical protein